MCAHFSNVWCRQKKGPGFSKVYFVSEIGLLKSLSELKLDKYQFIGSIPTELGNLENLGEQSNAKRY